MTNELPQLTDEEVAAMPSITEEDLLVLQQFEAAQKSELLKQQAIKESAIKKLAKLGLTEDEAKAVIGL